MNYKIDVVTATFHSHHAVLCAQACELLSHLISQFQLIFPRNLWLSFNGLIIVYAQSVGCAFMRKFSVSSYFIYNINSIGV